MKLIIKISLHKQCFFISCFLIHGFFSCNKIDEDLENTNIDYTNLSLREANTSVENVDPFTVCGDCLTSVYPNQTKF